MRDILRYQKFILIVQADTLLEALKIAGTNLFLQKVVFYLEYEHKLYQKNTN